MAAAASNPLASTHEYDHGDWMLNNWLWKAASSMARIESMDITNDPRFFAGNVMEKRLSAFKSLTLVSSIMFGTALKQCFVLKKDMNFEEVAPLVGNLAMWQIIAFFLALMVAIQCLLSLYIIAQQLFYVYRLMTAGSLGFDLAAVFYLTRTITMWRHLAIKLLFNGMLKFLVLVGIQLFVTFYNDASAVQGGHDDFMAVNMIAGTSQNHTVDGLHLEPPVHLLSMKVHVGLGYLCLAICTIVAGVMYRIRQQHAAVFGENYKHCEIATQPLERAVAVMGTRAGHYAET